MMGDLETGRPITYTGRIIPIVHALRRRQGRPRAHRVLRKAGGQSAGAPELDRRARASTTSRSATCPRSPANIQPRLIQARVKAGEAGVERLIWTLPADFAEDQYDDWLKLEGQDQVDRSIFCGGDRRAGSCTGSSRCTRAGLYRDELAYPHWRRWPWSSTCRWSPATSWTRPPRARVRELAGARAGHAAAHDRRRCEDRRPTPIVQWDEPISPAENAAILARLATFPGVIGLLDGPQLPGREHLGGRRDAALPGAAALVAQGDHDSRRRSSTPAASTPTKFPAPATSTSWPNNCSPSRDKRDLLKKVNVVIHPITNPDGAQLSVDLAKITPDNMLHPGYHGSLSADVSAGQTETDPIYPGIAHAQAVDRRVAARRVPESARLPFARMGAAVLRIHRLGAEPAGRQHAGAPGGFRAAGSPAWATCATKRIPTARVVAYAIQDRIVEAEREVPGLLPLEDRMNARYERFGQRWQPRDMFQPIVDGIRIYMSLKGSGGGGRGGAGGAGGDGAAGGAGTPGSGGVGGLSADVTWDAAYTEAPDETAHGDYMKLMASAGLAFDYVHLRYLAEGDLRITRTEREAAGAVQWRVERARPILPPGMKPLPAAGATDGQ